MQRADVIALLIRTFDDNKSVNYVIRQGIQRDKSLKALMTYAYDICSLWGRIIAADGKGVALIKYSDKEKPSLKSVLSDVNVLFNCFGVNNLRKVLRREALIKAHYPKKPFIYLFFIGVAPELQKKGLGTEILKEVLKEADFSEKEIYLETSAPEVLPFYKKHGFEIYAQLDLGYTLYLMRRTND